MHMRLRTITVAVIAIMSMAIAQPVMAIQYGKEDGYDHPFVAGLVWETSEGQVVGCSGTLVAPTVVLTAAHCLEGGGLSPTYVTFDPYFKSGESAVFAISGWTTYLDVNEEYLDVALVYLDPATPVGIVPASIAEERILTNLAPSADPGNQPRDLIAVGYGTTGLDRGTGAPPQFTYLDIRMRSTNRIINIDTPRLGDIWLQTSAAPGTGGGTCYGDSGGPFLLDGNVVVAITITGSNPNCGGNDLNLRIDNPDVRAFIIDALYQ